MLRKVHIASTSKQSMRIPPWQEKSKRFMLSFKRVFCFLALVLCLVCKPAVSMAAAGSIAVFPLQELGKWRNEVNLPVTEALVDKLAASGNDVLALESVIAFMANSRIRTIGSLESYQLTKVWQELAVPLVMLGTVCQLRERPEPSLGLSLQLVRVSDARTIWSYVGSISAGDERRLLAIGEPTSVADLLPLLLDELLEQWPWEIIAGVQQSYQVTIDSFILQPQYVAPGAEVSSWVRLRKSWPADRSPRVFFKVDDQLHAAKMSADDMHYESTWVSGEQNGRVSVDLILEWPEYGRRESAPLGSYVVDGMLPLLDFTFGGTQDMGGNPAFRSDLIIIPRPLVRKPLNRWRVSFYDEKGDLLTDEKGSGNLPYRIVWNGRARHGESVEDGEYLVTLEAWDLAGNYSIAEHQVWRSYASPQLGLAVERNDETTTINLESDNLVPLSSWRMEMWTKEGKYLAHASGKGKDLPARVGIEQLSAEQYDQIQGYVVVIDVLGNRSRRKVEDMLPKLQKPVTEEVKETKPAGVSETWVNEF